MFADDVWRYMPLDPAPSLILAGIGGALLVYVALASTRETRILAGTLLAVTVLAVLAYTGRGALSNEDGVFAWRIGESIRSEWNNENRPLGMINIFGNVAMFLPVGWLVAILASRRTVVAGTIAGTALSACIEIWQMLSGSFGDVDDLVLNASGAAIGAVLGTLLSSCRRKLGSALVTGTSESASGTHVSQIGLHLSKLDRDV